MSADPQRDPRAGAQLLDVLAVDPVTTGVWRSRRVDPRGGRMFGGTTVAHMLAAARFSVTGPSQVSSVTVQFIRPADGGIPCDFCVESVYDGRSSATRHVTVIQHGQTMAIGNIAFHTPRQAWTHGQRQPRLHPETLPQTGAPYPARAIPPGAFDIRYQDGYEDGTFVRRLWFRAIHPLPDSAMIHECALALISDLYFFEPIVAQHGYKADDRSIRYGTTQHSMWFHQAPRVDDWLLIESCSPVAAGGRGLVCGAIRTTEGVVVATVVQEVAVRFTDASLSADTV